jgi:hypothetical protein
MSEGKAAVEKGRDALTPVFVPRSYSTPVFPNRVPLIDLGVAYPQLVLEAVPLQLCCKPHRPPPPDGVPLCVSDKTRVGWNGALTCVARFTRGNEVRWFVPAAKGSWDDVVDLEHDIRHDSGTRSAIPTREVVSLENLKP